MGRRSELSDRVDQLVAVARAHRIREAWSAAARKLRIEHRVAPRLFDDVLEGVVAGVPVRVLHLPLREMRRVHMVVEADGVGALPRELSLQGAALLDAFEAATADFVRERAGGSPAGETDAPPSSRRDGPPSSVYREQARADFDADVRGWLLGAEGEAVGVAARDGKIVYQHAAPLEDGRALASLLSAVATIAATLARTA